MKLKNSIKKCREFESYNDDIQTLFSTCMFKASSEKIKEVFKDYIRSLNKELFLYKEDEFCFGLIAIEILKSKIVIGHIATSEKMRSKNIATGLINYVMTEYPSLRVEAETDNDAVEFYRKVGFTITSLGENYPGFPRYSCSKNISLHENSNL